MLLEPKHEISKSSFDVVPKGRSGNVRVLEHHIWARVQHSPLASMWDLHGVPVKEVVKRTWQATNEDSLLGRASQLAYAFFSAIFPALIAMSAILGIVAKSWNGLYLRLLERIGHLIPPSAYILLVDTFRQTENASSAGKITLGVIVALFSASIGVSAIQDTLNTVYKVRETRAFWRARLEAMGLTVLVALIIIAALLTVLGGDFGATHVQNLFRGSWSVAIVLRILAWTVASLCMILTFQVLYYFCPDVQHRKWRWFTPGAFIGLVGWISGSVLLRVYLHFFNNYSVTYGSLGAVLILLLWFYVTGVMILLGGEINSEIEHAVAQRQLKAGECPLPPDSAVAKIDI